MSAFRDRSTCQSRLSLYRRGTSPGYHGLPGLHRQLTAVSSTRAADSSVWPFPVSSALFVVFDAKYVTVDFIGTFEAKHGYDVILESGEMDPARQKNQVESFIIQNVDAIVLLRACVWFVGFRQLVAPSSPRYDWRLPYMVGR